MNRALGKGWPAGRHGCVCCLARRVSRGGGGHRLGQHAAARFGSGSWPQAARVPQQRNRRAARRQASALCRTAPVSSAAHPAGQSRCAPRSHGRVARRRSAAATPAAAPQRPQPQPTLLPPPPPPPSRSPPHRPIQTHHGAKGAAAACPPLSTACTDPRCDSSIDATQSPRPAHLPTTCHGRNSICNIGDPVCPP